jgi:hypothetical protein
LQTPPDPPIPTDETWKQADPTLERNVNAKKRPNGAATDHLSTPREPELTG